MLAALERGWNEDVPEEGHNDSAFRRRYPVLRCHRRTVKRTSSQTIKRAIEQGIRFRECAIFVRDLRPYLPMIRRCLASSGIPRMSISENRFLIIHSLFSS